MPSYIAYLRVSTSKQGQSGLGLDAQEAAVVHFLRHGDVLLKTFVEVESGKGNARPQLSAALAECRHSSATLLVAKLDRLSRNLHFISGLMEAGVSFVACDMPNAREFELHIHAALAQHERRLISDRTRAALEAARARGIKLGGFRGRHLTDAERTAGRAKAAMVRRAIVQGRRDSLLPMIATIRRAGAETLRDIADALNERGIMAPRGGRWHPTQINRIMASPPRGTIEMPHHGTPPNKTLKLYHPPSRA
jgi:DNA invertase Pin-like site-specific DNA recombinase